MFSHPMCTETSMPQSVVLLLPQFSASQMTCDICLNMHNFFVRIFLNLRSCTFVLRVHTWTTRVFVRVVLTNRPYPLLPTCNVILRPFQVEDCSISTNRIFIVVKEILIRVFNSWWIATGCIANKYHSLLGHWIELKRVVISQLFLSSAKCIAYIPQIVSRHSEMISNEVVGDYLPKSLSTGNCPRQPSYSISRFSPPSSHLIHFLMKST